MKPFLLSAFAFALLFASIGCSVFGIRTVDEPGHVVLESDGDFELREYESFVVARTSVEESYDDAGSISFRRLFRYISGENVREESIAMTAPVLQQNRGASGEKIAMTATVLQQRVTDDEGPGRWEMSFVLPAEYSIETAPLPTDPKVRLEVVPARTVAVLRYRGSLSEESYSAHVTKLAQRLAARGYEASSAPRSAGYDPPWTIPQLRRNEIHINVHNPAVGARRAELSASTLSR